MNSGELYDLFRSDVVDTEKPYLWTDTEVFQYMNDAYRMFVRLTGGIADVTSDVTQIPVVIGESIAEVSPLILRFRQAWLNSTGRKVQIINQEEIEGLRRDDYGVARLVTRDNSAGPVRYMVIGEERGKVRWVQVPVAEDIVQLSVYRLPLDTIEEGDEAFEFPEIGNEHVFNLAMWMKHKAYGKQDAETFDRGRRDQYKADFAEYCAMVTAEQDRYRAKVRSVVYGGI